MIQRSIERIKKHGTNILNVIKYKNKYSSEYLDLSKKEFKINKKYLNKIIIRIINAYNKSKEDQKKVSKPYQIGGSWNEIIKKDYYDLIFALKKENIVECENLLSNFCRDLSRGLEFSGDYQSLSKKNKFFYFKSYYMFRFNKKIDLWKKYVGNNLKELDFPRIGNPFGLMIDGNLITSCSMRHDYYAKRILEYVGNIKKPVIHEIGGGFGGLAYYLFKRAKNKKIKYINFDIPEIIAINSYFLMLAYPNLKFRLYGEKPSDADIELLPNFAIKKMKNNSVDLVFNSHSFIEMDDFTVKEYIK